MASVTAKVTFSCPHCDKVLKASTRPAAGKKIKCPACDEPFVPNIDDGDDATGIQERPSLKTKSREMARDNDNDDNARPARKKAKKNANGSLMLAGLVVVGGGFLFLMCAGVGLGAFVWPGFLLSKPKTPDKQVAKNDDAKANDNVELGDAKGNPGDNKGNPGDNKGNPGGDQGDNVPRAALSAYVLPDANVVLGMNVKGLRDSNQLAGMINLFKGARGEFPPDVADMAGNCDRILMSMNVDTLANQAAPFGGPFAGPNGGPANQPRMSMALQMSNAAAVEQLKGMPGMLAAERLPGKHAIYRQQNFNGPRVLIAIPNERLIVISLQLNEQEFTALLDRAARNEAGMPALVKLNALVEQSHFWAAYVLDAQTRQKMQQELDRAPLPPKAPPAARQWMNALVKINGGALAVDSLAGGSWKGTIHIECADANAARSLKDAADWLKLTAIDELRKPQFGQPPPPPSLVRDFNGLTVGQQATIVSATMTVSAPTVTEMAKLMPGVGMPKQPAFPNDFPKAPRPPFNPPPPFKNPPGKGRLLSAPGDAMQSFVATNLAENGTTIEEITVDVPPFGNKT